MCMFHLISFITDDDDVLFLDEDDVVPPSDLSNSKKDWNNYVNLENGGNFNMYNILLIENYYS